MEQHQRAIQLYEDYKDKHIEINEADTRNRIIDTVLYEILSWPKSSVGEEHHNSEGFTDYILYDGNKHGIVILEAKKQGLAFETPRIDGKKSYTYMKLETLMTSTEINKAILQVRNYCLDMGVMFGWITNGDIWILFKVFASNWSKQNAFVIKSLNFFCDDFTFCYNNLGFDAVRNRNNLSFLLNPKSEQYRLTYSIKEKISSSNVAVDLNAYAQYLSKPINYYFSDFPEDDTDFIKKCYVDEQLYKNTKQTLKNIFNDTASPFLKNYGVIDYDRNKLSSKLSRKITNFLSYKENKHIVVIFGDRGCGKSTFIRKLIKYDIEPYVLNRLKIVYINLLRYAATNEKKENIKQKIWKAVIEEIDTENLLDDYNRIQNTLFPEVFSKLNKQLLDLYGDNVEPSIKGARIEEKISQLKSDYEKTAKALSKFLRDNKKSEIVVILDNTDQYTSEIQEFSFQVISEVFNVLKCLSIITMREERFYRSKTVGVLDAFETTQYHIASPHPDRVFIERIKYFIDSLNDDLFFENLINNKDIQYYIKEFVTKDKFKDFFIIFLKDFLHKENLYKFLVSCAQKDMRKALELFRDFTKSGYLNIIEMLKYGTYNLQIHQVLKPIMTPNKYYYEEKESSVPNLFKLRYTDHGSHFTTLRILKRLVQKSEEYFSVSILKNEFTTVFNMEEDFIASTKELLHFKLIEANIKIDEYDPTIEKIQITPFGVYMLESLAHFFSYLDLICVDCFVYSESVAHEIAFIANEEYKLFHKKERGLRLIQRIKKTDLFFQYLINEERREQELFGNSIFGNIAIELAKKYEDDLKAVRKSALKQRYATNEEDKLVSDFFFTRKDISNQ